MSKTQFLRIKSVHLKKREKQNCPLMHNNHLCTQTRNPLKLNIKQNDFLKCHQKKK